jgi:hypothetical protein
MIGPLTFPEPRRFVPHWRPSAYLAFGLTGLTDQGRPICQGLNDVTLQGITIPAGFETDWSSIPAVVAALDTELAVFGKTCLGSYLHDYLIFDGMGRAERSMLARAQWLLDGVDPETAELMYLAVLDWPGSENETLERVAPLPAATA